MQVIDDLLHLALGEGKLLSDGASGDDGLALGVAHLGQAGQNAGVSGEEGPGHAVCSWFISPVKQYQVGGSS